jgi:hypothetical protein
MKGKRQKAKGKSGFAAGGAYLNLSEEAVEVESDWWAD